jgi:hypothetical protein
MNWLVQRYSNVVSNNGSTQGLLFERDSMAFFSHTIEDEGRAVKVMGETRIWSGVYELKILRVDNDWVKSHRAKYNKLGDEWFKYPIEITNVRDFKGILVHVGYGEKDTEGCLLLSDTIGNNTVDAGYIGGRSMEAVKRWYSKVYPFLDGGGRSWIEFRDESKLV